LSSVQAVEDGAEPWRVERVVQSGELGDRHPPVLEEVAPLVVEQPVPRGFRPGPVEPGEKEVLRPDEASTLPAHVPVDGHVWRAYGRGVEPGLLGQLPPGRLEGRLTGLDPATGRLPEAVAVGGITPAEQQHPAARIDATRIDTENPRHGPMPYLHALDVSRE
jgi:hypothetical protein